MADFLDSLNKQQRRAACYEGGGVLVLAGAGTGKTRVLTARIAWLIAHCNYSPRDILAVTFTNKAAKEMRNRVGKLVSFRPGELELELGTFHGICHRMLRRHAEAAGWEKNFQILNSQDQKKFIFQLLKKNNINHKDLPPNECASYINQCKELSRRVDDVPEPSGRDKQLLDVYTYYEKACKHENKLDFAELLLSSIELLNNHEKLRQQYASQFHHVLIDELQDTNQLQYRWLKLLNSGDNVFFAVGDDDQCIYTFRGADPQNMRRIQRDLRIKNIIYLEQNYRSTNNILSVANRLIKSNKDRLKKKLFTNDSDGEPVKVYEAKSGTDEASAIASAIANQIDAGVSPAEIAVLYRANKQSELLEKAMIDRSLPYQIYGKIKFFDRQEIKNILAYLRLIVADDCEALMRVINVPPREIGEQTINALSSGGDIFAAVEKSDMSKVIVFRDILHKLRELRAGFSLVEMVHATVEASGLLAYYESRTQEQKRAENLREFVSAVEQFPSDNEDKEPLTTFFESITLESDEKSGDVKDAVNLMTVHAAKGLEFSHVHIAGMEERRFPSHQSLEAPHKIEEERRLMYVAITRARKALFLYWANQRVRPGQQPHTCSRSRFVNELQLDKTDSLGASSTALESWGCPLPQNDTNYLPGEYIRHAKYGVGVIVRCEGQGEKLTVEIAFKHIGIKRFLAAKARLERVRQ